MTNNNNNKQNIVYVTIYSPTDERMSVTKEVVVILLFSFDIFEAMTDRQRSENRLPI